MDYGTYVSKKQAAKKAETLESMTRDRDYWKDAEKRAMGMYRDKSEEVERLKAELQKLREEATA